MGTNQVNINFSVDDLLNRFDPDNKLEAYYDQLLLENKKLNLVSRETSRGDLKILAAESLLPLTVLEGQQFHQYLDIGSGGGFPSFPIIMCDTVKSATLVERIGKKAAALNRMATALNFQLPFEIHRLTLEDIKFKHKFNLITIRLVKLTPSLLSKIMRNLNKNGQILYYSTPEFEIKDPDISCVSYSYTAGSKTTKKSFSLIQKK